MDLKAVTYFFLQEMHLVQNQYTQIGMVVAAKYWTEFHRINPAIKVQLVLQGRARTDVSDIGL